MSQPDEWKSPYDPPKQPDAPQPGPAYGPGPGSAPGQAGPPSPYQQPYQQQQQWDQQGQPYPPQPYPGQQPYPYGAPYYGYAAPLEKNSLGVWSLVLGILSVILLFACGVGGFLAGIPAIITGHLSRRAQKEGQADNGGMGLVGIITGWVTIGLTLLLVVGIVILFSIPEFREGFFSESTSSG
ncbi:DUF4190 domain-containing protein [Promicromonospora sp. NPDC050262]|uniref:DUF4190 domain-containing protein n=1 Tax=Promicromonospora sp. NPDC050262 TaxID=3155036 RepID=UPI0033E6D227